MDDERQTHLFNLRQAHERRLQQLEQQAARFGYSTPPEVRNEINDIRELIGGIDQQLGITTQSSERGPRKVHADEWDVELLFAQASRLVLQGDLRYALQLYLRIEQINPMYPRIQARIAEVKTELDRSYIRPDGTVDPVMVQRLRSTSFEHLSRQARSTVTVNELLIHFLYTVFKRPLIIVIDELKKIKNDGTILFLIQGNQTTGSKLFLRLMRSFLVKLYPSFRYIPITFSYTSGDIERELTKVLSSYFKLEQHPKMADIKFIIDRISDIDGTTYIKISGPLSSLNIRFLIYSFWIPLTRRSSNNRIIGVMAPTEKIDHEEIFFTPDQLSSQRIVEIPLSKWSQEDIQAWLVVRLHFETGRAEQTAETIYNESNHGEPLFVFDAIKKIVSSIIVNNISKNTPNE